MDGDVRDLDDRSGAELAAAEQAEINAEEQTSSWEQREARLAHRERLADERERLADARERAADVRERTADEREGLADDRERAADQREYLADQREQRLNDLEARLDARARSAGVSTETVPERVMEAITRGRSLLAASSANLDRSEAAVERQRVHHQRQQEAVEREIVAAGRAFASPMTEPTPPQVDRADLLRRRFLALAAEIVKAEEQIADVHERAATDDPTKRSRNLEIAQKARDAASHARQAAEHLTARAAEGSRAASRDAADGRLSG